MSFQLSGEFWSMDTSNIRIKVQVVLALGEIVLFKILAENQQKQGFYIFSGTADIVSTYIPIYQAQTNIASRYTKLRPKALPDIEIILHFSDIEKTSRQLHETNKSYYSHYNKNSEIWKNHTNYPRLYGRLVAEQQTKLAGIIPSGNSQWIRPVLSLFVSRDIVSDVNSYCDYSCTAHWSHLWIFLHLAWPISSYQWRSESTQRSVSSFLCIN